MPVTIDGTSGITTPGVVNSGSETIGGTLGVTGAVTLTTTLGVAQGGTGAAALTSGSVLVGAGTSAVSLVAAGSNGNLLTSNGTTWTSATPAGSLGIGQTWTNVTASRAYGTTYTNSTGKPISVTVSGESTGSGSFIHIAYVNSNEIAYQTTYSANAGYRHNVFFIVPNSATYSVTGVGGNNTTSLYLWSELR